MKKYIRKIYIISGSGIEKTKSRKGVRECRGRRMRLIFKQVTLKQKTEWRKDSKLYGFWEKSIPLRELATAEELR